jgi:hypothetical protein
MNKNIVYPIILAAAVTALTVGCGRAPTALEQATQTELQAAKLAKARGERSREEGKAQVMADNAATQVAQTHDRNLRIVGGQSLRPSYGHSYGGCNGKGYVPGVGGLNVKVETEVNVGVHEYQPREQRERTGAPDIDF